MQRVAFVFNIKSEHISEYKQHHRAVWPEMQEALSRNGWKNYSLYLHPEGKVFGYFETPEDFQTALAKMDEESINAKWQELMSPFVDSDGSNHPDKVMLELEEIFHLD